MKNTTSYRLDRSGDFVIEDYNNTKAFSSFFPGIAGLNGIPLWAFYVNRGQAVCSFGTKDKDAAILEFMPANQAYHLTAVKGFRTFLKIRKAGKEVFYEPFKASNIGKDTSLPAKMTISPYELEIEEINKQLGLKVNISYTTVPEEPFAGLLRNIRLENISDKAMRIEMLDGLPQIVPYGMTEWHQKHMSRTIEAWMTVLNLDKNAPFYRLKINPQDSPELEYIERGNFYLSCRVHRGGCRMLKAVVDPDIVFGPDADISYPAAFAADKAFAVPARQAAAGKTPAAFGYDDFMLEAGRCVVFTCLAGNAANVAELGGIQRRIQKDPSYYDKKCRRNAEIISRIIDRAFTKSSSDRFDFYSRHSYLDNILRGGYPVSIGTKKGPFVFYAYARKHGDLERDYNAFSLQPSYYSQGNGAYRDINQNRRNDIFFNPDVRDENIKTFMSAIQPDGFNPHLIEGISCSVADRAGLGRILGKYAVGREKKDKMVKFLSGDFTPGSLVSFTAAGNMMPRQRIADFLGDILALSEKNDVIRPGEGYWIDHWTYNIDMVESYLACYPDRLKNLLLDDRGYTFYDTFLRVLPRREKYVYFKGNVRQFGSVAEDKEKAERISRRDSHNHLVRTRRGKGKIYKTGLLVKFLAVIANKMASLDPFGMGIEMEAGKPGWCDSLNGLPAVMGSSLCETYELKRLIIFIKKSISSLKMGKGYKVAMPSEICDLIRQLRLYVRNNLKENSRRADLAYWKASAAAKESYRDKVWHGFSGGEKALSMAEIDSMLGEFLMKLQTGLGRAAGKKGPITLSYFINETKSPAAASFTHKGLPLFLEGPMHSMRTMDRASALTLYKAIRKSGLFDRKLKMYKINEPLKGAPLEIGRSAIFIPGWLENESVWLHMEYKYMLEVLKAGLCDEFFLDMKSCLVAFCEPGRYGRSILENSSFIVSSGHPDKRLHGRGFVARLTGATTEFLSMRLAMCLGKNPFGLDRNGSLFFRPEPAIPGWLFTTKEETAYFSFGRDRREAVTLAAGTFSFCLFGRTLVVYHNPNRRNTFGKYAARPFTFVLSESGGKRLSFDGHVPSAEAKKLRQGLYDRLDIYLE